MTVTVWMLCVLFFCFGAALGVAWGVWGINKVARELERSRKLLERDMGWVVPNRDELD